MAAAAEPPAPERLLEVEEDEVVIDFKPNSKCPGDLRLRSLHPSLPIAFKVQTSSPLKFVVSPPRGAVPPLSSAPLRVVLRPKPHAPPSFPRSRADRFLVLSSLSTARLDAIRLRVFFGGPHLLRLAADSGDVAAVAAAARISGQERDGGEGAHRRRHVGSAWWRRVRRRGPRRVRRCWPSGGFTALAGGEDRRRPSPGRAALRGRVPSGHGVRGGQRWGASAGDSAPRKTGARARGATHERLAGGARSNLEAGA